MLVCYYRYIIHISQGSAKTHLGYKNVKSFPSRCACLRPSGKAGTKLYCLVTEAHVCEQLA